MSCLSCLAGTQPPPQGGGFRIVVGGVKEGTLRKRFTGLGSPQVTGALGGQRLITRTGRRQRLPRVCPAVPRERVLKKCLSGASA